MYMAVKITGSVLIAAGGYITGSKIKRQYKKRRALLKSYQEALRAADDAIAIENVLIENVLKECGEKFFPECKGKDVWSMTANILESQFGSFERAWQKACEEYFAEAYELSEKDRDAISDIGMALGIANTQRQSAHVLSVLERLKSLEKEAETSEEKEGKNAVKISLALAAAIIVMLF